MAQINLTLSQEEILQVLTGDRNEALRFLLERILNEVMKAESGGSSRQSCLKPADKKMYVRFSNRAETKNVGTGGLV